MPIPNLEPNGFCQPAFTTARWTKSASGSARFKAVTGARNSLANWKHSLRKPSVAELRSLVVNGSFVTVEPAPNDIDLIVVVSASQDFSADLNPAEYNIVSKRRVRRRFGFDLLVAREDSVEYGRWTEFFQQVRLEPGRQKGILKVAI